GLRQGGDRQAVPCGEDLVVGRRVDSALADLEQLGPRRLQLAAKLLGIELQLRGDRLQRQRTPQDVRALPVAVRRGPERGRDGLARNAHQLVPGPDEEPALDALAVSV